MTKRNSSLKNRPFLLKPAGKDYLWGGNRLNDDFSKNINIQPLAETWECSTHPDGTSIVSSGVYKGMLLSDLLKQHPEFLGTHPDTNGELPILIKLIDAKKDLSIQVHPDDEYAKVNENGSYGKTEMWYVIDSSKDAKLTYGFHHDMDKETVKKSIYEGTIEKYLQKVPIKKDDVFFIEAGTVHAIGAGALIAEIQENSNITYRLYDYDRVDKNGQKRELHVDKALDVINLKSSAEPRQPMRVLKYKKGCATEFLCRCRYFQVERMLINTERCREMVDFKTESNSFQVLLCINGCGAIFSNSDTETSCENDSDKSFSDGAINFFRGDCIFVPANSEVFKFHGKAQFLKISC